MKKLTNEEILKENTPKGRCVNVDDILKAMSEAVKQRDEEIKEWIDKHHFGSNFGEVVRIDDFKQFLNQDK